MLSKLGLALCNTPHVYLLDCCSFSYVFFPAARDAYRPVQSSLNTVGHVPASVDGLPVERLTSACEADAACLAFDTRGELATLVPISNIVSHGPILWHVVTLFYIV